MRLPPHLRPYLSGGPRSQGPAPSPGPGLRVPGLRGVRVPELASDPAELALQRVHAALCALGPGRVLTGWGALLVHGVPLSMLPIHLPDGELAPVDVYVSRAGHESRRAGVRLRRTEPLPAEQLTMVDGLVVVTPDRAVLDVARWRPRARESLGILDAGLRFGLVEREGFASFLAPLGGLHGLAKVREALPMVSARAESLPESQLRFEMLAAGIGPLRVNVEIYDDRGRMMGRADLWDDEAAMVSEYQGMVVHAGRDEMDGLRLAGFRELGITTEEVWRHDLWHPVAMLARLRAARERGLARDRRRDRFYARPMGEGPIAPRPPAGSRQRAAGRVGGLRPLGG